MDFNRAEPTRYLTNFLRQLRLTKLNFFRTCSTTRNAPCVHPRLDSILELCPTFPIEETAGLYMNHVLYWLCKIHPGASSKNAISNTFL